MTTKKCYELGATSPFQAWSERASGWQSCEGQRKRQAFTFFPRTLLLHLLSRAICAWLLLISLKWRACTQAVKVFIVLRDGCIVIIMAQSIPSITIPPKAIQRAKKVVSDSPGLVDFAIGLVIFVLNLPDGQVLFFGEIQITEGW